MANALNNFFVTNNEKPNIQLIETGDAVSVLKEAFPGNFSQHTNNPITEAEIKSIIHSLKPNKSSGYDEITSKILNVCAFLIGHQLSYIYNYLLYTGIFPGHLKIATVQPLCMKGDKTSMTNYRPI